MNIRTTHSELYTPIYDHFMLQQFNGYEQKCGLMFKEIDDNTSEWKSDDLSDLGTWDLTNEAEAGDVDDPVLGYPATFIPLKYTKTMECSFEAVDDDEYALLGKIKQSEIMGRGAKDRTERLTAGILNGVFTTVGPDGQFLADTDHPKNRNETGTTFDNLLSGAFSHDNLEAAEAKVSANLFSMSGIPMSPTKEIVLAFAPANRGPVARVLSERAGERPGTANRDINRFVGMGTTFNYKQVEWIYLSAASDFGGSNTAWHMIFAEFEYLKLIWRQRPYYASWVDEDKDLYKFKGRMRCVAGCDNWRYGFSSTGV